MFQHIVAYHAIEIIFGQLGTQFVYITDEQAMTYLFGMARHIRIQLNSPQLAVIARKRSQKHALSATYFQNPPRLLRHKTEHVGTLLGVISFRFGFVHTYDCFSALQARQCFQILYTTNPIMLPYIMKMNR